MEIVVRGQRPKTTFTEGDNDKSKVKVKGDIEKSERKRNDYEKWKWKNEKINGDGWRGGDGAKQPSLKEIMTTLSNRQFVFQSYCAGVTPT